MAIAISECFQGGDKTEDQHQTNSRNANYLLLGL